MSPPTRHNNLLYFSFFWLFLGSFFVRSQLNVPPTIETNSGTGPEIIHCTTDPLIFTLHVSPTSSNSVLKYQYIRDRGNVNSNLTGLTVSTTINQSLTALQDGDIVFAEIYLENNNGVFQKISETNTLTIRLVDPPEVIITHDGQTTTAGEVFCLGTPTTITVAPSGFQPGTNAYEFYVDNVLHQGPSAQNIFTYTFSRNSSLTIRVNNACVYERTLAFKGNGVNPGSIVVSHTQIVSVVPATHNGYVSNNATITYGWESSFDNITWSPVLSAQASSLTFLPFGVVVYYRRVGISNGLDKRSNNGKLASPATV